MMVLGCFRSGSSRSISLVLLPRFVRLTLFQQLSLPGHHQDVLAPDAVLVELALKRLTTVLPASSSAEKRSLCLSASAPLMVGEHLRLPLFPPLSVPGDLSCLSYCLDQLFSRLFMTSGTSKL